MGSRTATGSFRSDAAPGKSEIGTSGFAATGPELSNLRATIVSRPGLKLAASIHTAKNWLSAVGATTAANWLPGRFALSVNAERQSPGVVVMVLPSQMHHISFSFHFGKKAISSV